MPTQLIAGDNQNEASIVGSNDGAIKFRIGPAGSKADGLSISSVGDVAALGKLTQKGGAPVPRMLLLPAKATTSGTSIDFSPSDGTAIPSWAKKLTVTFSGVSTSGISPVQIQLGTTSGIEATGYSGGVTGGSGGIASLLATTGAPVTYVSVAASAIHGGVRVCLNSGSSWVTDGSLNASGTATFHCSGTSKTVSGTLDRIRITTVNGTDTFDAGSISILVEGYE